VVGGEEQTAIGTVFAFPIIDAAIGDDFGIGVCGVTPDFLAGGGIESDDRVVVGDDVHNAIDDEGTERVVIGIFYCIGPGDFEMRDVAAVDLSQGGVLGGIGRATIVGPSEMRLGEKAGHGPAPQKNETEESHFHIF